MGSSNVSSVTKYFASPNEGFTTTLGSTITAGASTVPLNSVADLTDGAIFVGIIDPGSTNQEVFTGTVSVSGVSIINAVWTRSPAGGSVAHTTGAAIVDYVTGTAFKMLTTGILKQHTQAGGHIGLSNTGGLTNAGGIATDTLHVTGATELDGAVTGAGFSQATITNPCNFSVYANADQALTSSTWTKVQLNTEDFDVGSNFDNATNYRFTAPANGKYFFSGQIGLTTAGASSGVPLRAALYKNGSAAIFTSIEPGSGSASAIPRLAVNKLFALNANDYIELFAYIGESARAVSGLSTDTFLTGFVLSA